MKRDIIYVDKFEREVFSIVFFKKSLHSRSYGTIFWRKIAEKYRCRHVFHSAACATLRVAYTLAMRSVTGVTDSKKILKKVITKHEKDTKNILTVTV